MNRKLWLLVAVGCLECFSFWAANAYPNSNRARSRVVWITQKGAALGWDDKAWDQRANGSIVASMLEQSVRALAGQATIKDAWDYLFIQHNNGSDYKAGEKIAIKINNNNHCSYQHTTDHCPLPQVLVPLLSQLINHKGVQQSDITIFDVSRGVPDYIVDTVKRIFPFVRFGAANHCSSQTVFGAKLSQDLVNAKYLINMPLLRTHFMAGAT
ncbi:MAG: DUF362 domain-containing protein, partial [Deltaproteobacteria bacterium]|nr:DUF362 domain-containing protein [Deltaproteobacteria bacterium]